MQKFLARPKGGRGIAKIFPSKDFAGYLRRNATGAEGYHFRRQVPIGNYIADFACYRKRVLIELDDGQHSRPDRKESDDARTAELAARGFKVIRFWNVDVFTNLEGVVDQIRPELGLR